MSIELFLFIIAVIGWTYGFWQRSKAKEFENLFELSKSYNVKTTAIDPNDVEMAIPGSYKVKLNKDGSIAKKRGRKPKNGTKVNS